MRSTTTPTVPQQAGEPLQANTAGVTEFGAVVARWCDDHGYKQGDLADDAGLHRSSLSRMLRGQREVTDAAITALEGIMRTGGALADAAERSNQQRAARTVPAARRRPVPAQLPAVNSTLHGRDQELAALAACGPAPGLRLFIDGPPGVGKTALAVRHAHRLASSYRAGVLFADLRGHDRRADPADPAEVLADFLHTLGLAVPEAFDDRVRAWRSATWTSRLLIVLDDARSAEQITPLLPGGSGCAVLLTSRFRLSSVLAGSGVQSLTVAPLRRSQSIGLLQACLGHRVEAELDIAGRVAELCGDFPRALSLAAERLSVHPEVSLKVLVSEHEDRWALTEIGDEPGCSMRATLRGFAGALPGEHRRAWRVLGAGGGRMTSRRLTEATGWSAGHTRHILDGLVLAHLLTRREDTYEMNDLLAAWGALMHEREQG